LKKELSDFIRKASENENFIKCGFSKFEILKKEGELLKAWLDENRNGEMKWMNNSFEKRINPSLIQEDIKSVISLAYIYDTPILHSEDSNIPRISRYAWGNRDYHKVIKKKLKSICSAIESGFEGVKTKYYIDDGPVMDKTWAVRSGIGWQGKNTNIISNEFGSFFFIGTIFINKELEYDKSTEDLCGSCMICINECPTNALYDEYKIDSNLCISYQTIENRGEIPESINIKGWIFGCDICQDVCPFNGKKIFTSDENFFPKEEVFNKSAFELINFSEEKFNKTFDGTPVKRTKYTGWIRNLKKFMGTL